jgi:hypothetical protein
MRLTKSNREAFAIGVLADVPDAKFDDRIQELVKAEILANMPDALRKLTADPEALPYLRQEAISFGWGSGVTSFRFFSTTGHTGSLDSVCRLLSPEGAKKVKALWVGFEAEKAAHEELRSKLTGAIASVSTVKRALELFPEFAKYLPVEAPKGSLLPMVVNLVPDLVKAGWPKDQQGEVKQGKAKKVK